MKKQMRVFLALLLLTTLLCAALPYASLAEGTEETGPDPNFHIYLALGQSNTVGWGVIEAQDRELNPRFLAMCTRDDDPNRALGKWYTAQPPLAAGHLSYLNEFGRAMVEALPEPVRVGVVVVAVSGCKIQMYDEENCAQYLATETNRQVAIDANTLYGGNPYRRLVDMAKEAQKQGVIKGILLHQGESNIGDELWQQRVKGVYESLLSELNLSAEDVPLLAGETVRAEQGGVFAAANPMIDSLPEYIPTAHVISSEGLSSLGNWIDVTYNITDYAHFNAASCRTLGRRYAAKMLETVKVSTWIETNVEELELSVGGVAFLNTRLMPLNRSYGMSFSSSDTDVVTVSDYWGGQVVAKDEGEATLTIRYSGAEKYEPCEKTIHVRVTGPAYNAPSYRWSSDHRSCTAQRTHRGTSSKNESETVSVIPVVTPATCTREGRAVYTADFQNPAFETQVYTETLAKIAHTPGTAVRENEIPATCSREGSYDEVVCCSVCGEELSRTQKSIPKIAHTPGAAVRENERPASCSREGSYDEVVCCSVCGEELSRTQKSMPKTAHTPGAAVRENEIPASCSREGSYDLAIYCTLCSEEISRTHHTIPKLAPPTNPAAEGSITLYGAGVGQSVSVYRYLQPAEGGALTPTTGWESFFRGAGSAYLTAVTAPPQPRLVLDGAVYTLAVTEENAAGFVAALLDEIRSGRVSPQSSGTTDEAGQAVWSGLPLGAYLVWPEGCMGNLCLLTEEKPNAVLAAKASTASLEKTVQGSASADAGGYVRFQLKSTVPDSTGYAAYVWQVQDLMDPGLAFDAAEAELLVTVGGTPIATDGLVEPLTMELGGVSRAGFTLTLPMDSLQGSKGAELLITYRARVTAQASSTLTENYARLRYGESTAARETPWATATVWSNRIVVDKHAAGAPEQKLEGAEFVLLKKSGGTELYCRIEQDGSVSWVTEQTAASVRRTDGGGAAEFAGLADGMYYLRELRAPDGYTPLREDIGVQVQGKAEESLEGKLVGQSSKTPVENRAGTRLPSTGGAGTAAYTAAGVWLMGASLAVALRLRSKNKKEKAF